MERIYEHELEFIQTILENYRPVVFSIGDESILSKDRFITEMKKYFGIVPFVLIPGKSLDNCIAVGFREFKNLDSFGLAIEDRIEKISKHYNVSIGYFISRSIDCEIMGSDPIGPTQN